MLWLQLIIHYIAWVQRFRPRERDETVSFAENSK